MTVPLNLIDDIFRGTADVAESQLAEMQASIDAKYLLEKAYNSLKKQFDDQADELSKQEFSYNTLKQERERLRETIDDLSDTDLSSKYTNLAAEFRDVETALKSEMAVLRKTITEKDQEIDAFYQDVQNTYKQIDEQAAEIDRLRKTSSDDLENMQTLYRVKIAELSNKETEVDDLRSELLNRLRYLLFFESKIAFV